MWESGDQVILFTLNGLPPSKGNSHTLAPSKEKKNNLLCPVEITKTKEFLFQEKVFIGY